MKLIFGCSLIACILSIRVGYAIDLLEAYNLGLTSDPKVLAAEANRNSVQKTKPIGLANLLPSVVLNLNASGLQADTGKSPYVGQTNTAVIFGQGSINLQLKQPLFRYDAWVTYWQADYKLAQAQAQLEAEYQDLAVRVAKAYFEVLYAEDIVDYTNIQLKGLEAQADMVKERLNLGFSTVVDLNETESRRDKIAADLIQAEQKLNDAREALREIIGVYEYNLIKLPEYIPLNSPVPEDIEKWSEVAQQGNLQIISASSAAEIARHNIDLNYAGHLPTLDLTASQYTTGNNRPTGAYQLNQQEIGLVMSIPIYQGGGVSAKVDQARDLYEQSLHQLDQQRRSTQRLVKDAYRGVLTSIKRIGALQSALKSGLSALEGAQMGFQVGSRTIVDILVQQSIYFQYWSEYARARYDYLINGLMLKQAAGLLQQSDIDATNQMVKRKIKPAISDAKNLPKLFVPTYNPVIAPLITDAVK
ncbi:MAG: TolC family outer membrane protein [Methylococcus sp.]